MAMLSSLKKRKIIKKQNQIPRVGGSQVGRRGVVVVVVVPPRVRGPDSSLVWDVC